MKQRGGVTYMEVIFTAVAVFAAGVLVINKFVFEPEKKAEVTAEDRIKLQINALENKVKVMTDIEKRFQDLEADLKKAWDTLDHVQNLAENAEPFMKANEIEINNIKDSLKQEREYTHKLKVRMDQLKDVEKSMTVKLDELKKPLAVALQQTRAHRPVRVTWKKGHKGWTMVDKTVEYSRAEYLKKLKKQKVKKP